MAKPILPAAIWEAVESLLPPEPPRPKGGRPGVSNEACLRGILFIFKTGMAWEDLPQELGCGCGMTCWRRLRDWQEAGVWQKLLDRLLDLMDEAHLNDWNRLLVDSSSVRAVFGGAKTGPNPTDRSKRGTKHHLITDADGVPLGCEVTAANTHDVTVVMRLVDDVLERRRKRPEELCADKAYDSEPVRVALRERGILPEIPRRRTSDRGLGIFRWPVERTLGLIHRNRRLKIRYDRRADIHQAILTLGCATNDFSKILFHTRFC